MVAGLLKVQQSVSRSGWLVHSRLGMSTAVLQYCGRSQAVRLGHVYIRAHGRRALKLEPVEQHVLQPYPVNSNRPVGSAATITSEPSQRVGRQSSSAATNRRHQCSLMLARRRPWSRSMRPIRERKRTGGAWARGRGTYLEGMGGAAGGFAANSCARAGNAVAAERATATAALRTAVMSLKASRRSGAGRHSGLRSAVCVGAGALPPASITTACGIMFCRK